MRYLLLTILLLITQLTYAEEPSIALANAKVNLHDIKSIERGAKFFATNCMMCHTLVYLRYDTVAHDAGITYEKMPINVKAWPNGIKPPDMSNETNVRGPDWVYTFLHSFYLDSKRPTGFNNLLIPNTSMPSMLTPYQGQLVLAKDVKESIPIFGAKVQWFDVLEQQSTGIMSPDQFDATMRDVVNFLAYAADPYHEQQVHLGIWVIGFLLILCVLLYLLKKEYWKDIENDDEN